MSTSSPRLSHTWRLGPQQAVVLQRKLAGRVRLHPLPGPVRQLAGADVAYDPDSDLYYAALVVLSWPALRTLEVGRARGRTRFPYVPGLLSFREIPPLLRAYRRLRRRPDLILCDGHGLAHPRRFGLACHLGLLLGTPTLGCAKTLLVGEHGAVPPSRGSRVPLLFRGDRVGTVVRTRHGVKPVFVSPGQAITIGQAGDWVLRCCRIYRIPEPIRRAHAEVSRMRRGDRLSG